MQDPQPTPQEIAAFAARMLDQLARLAGEHDELALLAYLIGAAREEARLQAHPPPRPVE